MIYLRIVTILILTTFSLSSFAQQKISLSEVATHVKKTNYKVLENAQRVYQAKEMIHYSKRNLLPKLNLWKVIKLPFDWSAAIDIVQDIAPFLVPANWFRVSENKLLYLAQQEQYRALWANEIMTSKLLYLNTLRDFNFKTALEEQKNQIEELLGIAETRLVFGEVSPQTVKFLKIRSLELNEDLRVLKNLLYEEKKALSYLLGLAQEDDIELEKITLPNVDELEPIRFDTFIFRAIDHAPELTQYDFIKEALKYVRKEISFSFLGSSTTSRSMAGGIFSNIPIQDGLGFGLSSSLRISKSEKEILDINQNATKEVLKKNLYLLVNDFNSYVENVENQNERYSLAVTNYESIRTQLILGMKIDPLEILTSIENLFNAKVSLTHYRYEVVNVMEKVKRMIFNGDYSKNSAILEDLLIGENQ